MTEFVGHAQVHCAVYAMTSVDCANYSEIDLSKQARSAAECTAVCQPKCTCSRRVLVLVAAIADSAMTSIGAGQYELEAPASASPTASQNAVAQAPRACIGGLRRRELAEVYRRAAQLMANYPLQVSRLRDSVG